MLFKDEDAAARAISELRGAGRPEFGGHRVFAKSIPEADVTTRSVDPAMHIPPAIDGGATNLEGLMVLPDFLSTAEESA